MSQSRDQPSVKQEPLSPKQEEPTNSVSVFPSQVLKNNHPPPLQKANTPLAPMEAKMPSPPNFDFHVAFYDHSREQHNQRIANNTYDDDIDSRESSSISSNSADISRGGVTTPFQWKLHDMLEQIDHDGYGHVISWQSHGRAFMVHKPLEFVNEVMPIYFNQTKFASFQRQLNLYGFRRMTSGQDKGAYYHEFFLRGRRSQCQRMSRKKVKGTKVRRSTTTSCTGEPNFYEMPPMPSSNSTTKKHTGSSSSFSKPSKQGQKKLSQSQSSSPRLKKTKPVVLPQMHNSRTTLQIPVKPIDLPNAATVLTKRILTTNQENAQEKDGSVNTSSSPATPTLTAESDSPPIVEGFLVPPPPMISVPTNNVPTSSGTFTTCRSSTEFVPKMQSNEELDVLFFEGMPFHYLDKYNIIGELKTSDGSWNTNSHPETLSHPIGAVARQ